MNLEEYNRILFSECSDLSTIACPLITTELLMKNGLKTDDSFQRVYSMDIYPSEYFCPIDYYTSTKTITKKTHSIHWYGASWYSDKEKEEHARFQKYVRLLGKSLGAGAFGIVSCIKNEGLKGYAMRHAIKRKHD